MSQKLRARLSDAWFRLKYEELGAQTLEWLALALLILAILGGLTAVTADTNFADILRQKFIDMVGKMK